MPQGRFYRRLQRRLDSRRRRRRFEGAQGFPRFRQSSDVIVWRHVTRFRILCRETGLTILTRSTFAQDIFGGEPTE